MPLAMDKFSKTLRMDPSLGGCGLARHALGSAVRNHREMSALLRNGTASPPMGQHLSVLASFGHVVVGPNSRTWSNLWVLKMFVGFA